MKIKTIIAISAVCLVAQQGEAFNFGRIIGTIGKTVSGVNKIVNGFLNIYRNDPIVCEALNFKAKVVATNALCQLQDDLEAMQACQNFGNDCVAIPGRWGCGHFDGDDERGCMFRPVRAPGNRKLPKIIFDDETEDEAEIATLKANNQFPFARFGRHNQVSNAETLGDGDDVDYRDASHYYATTLTHDVNRYAEIFEENDTVQKNPVLALTAIVKALDLAGIRYPIGKSVCQVCKGICNKIMSGDNVNTCKYSACVGFLGGYKGPESNPSCDVIPLP